MNRTTIEDKLRALKVFPNTVEDNLKLFQKATNVQELDSEMMNRDTACSGEQFLYFHFNSLVKQKPEIVEEAVQKLGNYGIPPEIIKEYCNWLQPGLMLTLKYESQFPYEVREPFNDAAAQFAIDKMREYLEIK